MRFSGFPFVECAGLYARDGGNVLDAAAAQVDGGSKQGFGFCECGVLFHVFTSMEKVVRLEWDLGFLFMVRSIIVLEIVSSLW